MTPPLYALRAALVARCERGGLPPVALRAVFLVLAIALFYDGVYAEDYFFHRPTHFVALSHQFFRFVSVCTYQSGQILNFYSGTTVLYGL